MAGLHLTLLIPAVITFVVTLLAVQFARIYMLESGVTTVDHNKKKHPIIPTSGGLAVAFGFTFGILTYIFGGSFGFYFPIADINYLFATVLAVVLIAFIGFLDDINVSKTLVKTTGMMDYRKGLKQWQKPLFAFVGAIPLMAINAGNSVVSLPFIGPIAFGVLYPLVIIPLAVVFAANAFNLLGGFDGIASGSSLVLSFGLLIYSILYGNYNGTLLAAVLFASIFAFLLYDKYPAKIITGDSFSFFVGAAIVATIIVGNMEAFGLIVFAPWIIEFVLHLRKKFKTTDLGKLRADGTFEPPYGKKIYSWTHLIMNLKRCKEWEVSMYMWVIEFGFVALAFGLKILGLL
jgi:UDP-N-acetylglucosamine--dolichyl-phosphate N-acetylglucosaminephosphotransferase